MTFRLLHGSAPPYLGPLVPVREYVFFVFFRFQKNTTFYVF